MPHTGTPPSLLFVHGQVPRAGVKGEEIYGRERRFVPGVAAESQTLRAYPAPFKVNAAHILGYLSPITTEELRYGFRVTVIAMPSDKKWRTPAGIELGGPRHFRYDIDFVPVEERFGAAVGSN